MTTATLSTRALVREALAAAFQPDPDVTVSEWAAAHRVMTSETSGTVGPWRNDRNSLLTEIMDCLSPNSPVSRVTAAGPAQFGKSEIGLNWLGHTIHLAPRPFMLVRTDLVAAKLFSHQRIEKMVEACTPLKERVAQKKSRDKANTMFMKEFPGGILRIAGAKSAASLRDMPVACLWLDELDGFGDELEGEGDPAEIARNRTGSFGSRAKILETSTPTHEHRSRIWDAYLLGDRSRRELPCPHCGWYQVLRWSQLKWRADDDLTVHDVHYECEKCAQPILERQKAAMLDAGRWVAEKPERSHRHRSFHWNALYQPPGATSWAALAKQWVEIHKPRLKVGALKNFVMTQLAETYQQKGEAPEWEKLYRRREPYRFGTVPRGGLLLTAGVDVQGDRIQGSVYAWGRNLERWLVDRFTIPGDTATDGPWTTLEKLRTTNQYKHASGQFLQIRSLAVDSGYRTQIVYNWCRKKPGRSVMAIDGQKYVPAIGGSPKQMDVDFRGKKFARGVLVWPVGVAKAKEELYGWLQVEAPLKPDEPFPLGYCHFAEDTDEEFFKQLCGEEIRITKKGTLNWVRVYERNEALDEAVYARAAAWYEGIDRFSEEKWAELEAVLGLDAPASKSEGAGKKNARPSRPQAWRPRRWRPGR